MPTPMMATAVLMAALAGAGTGKAPARLFEGHADPTPQGSIDKAVFGRLKTLGIQPAKVCTDQVFVRRAYLDVIGTLPTPQEARLFLTNKGRGKRRALIDRLLERKEFADYWAMKWGDLLRVKAEFPINLWPNAAQAYSRWIRTSLKENVPYDRFVRELITASGSNFRVPPVNFYRALQTKEPQAIGQAVALAFMGVRAEKWSADRREGLAGFFSHIGYKGTAEWKEEIVFFDSVKAAEDAAAGKFGAAVFPDGRAARLSPENDPREVFADWLITPTNRWFARNIVNRIWYWLLGRGVIHEPDDIRPDNPARNPELLACLEKELIAARYDLKHVYRLILNSHAYQQSSISRTDHPDGEALVAFYPIRRLDAEVLIDALCQITGTTEEYSSLIPEPFTFMPADQRSIALPDGSITSPFLETFGRPPRDTGLASERNNNPTAAQRLHLLNSSHIRQKIERSPRLRPLVMRAKKDPRNAATALYLTILSRFPTQEELGIAKAYAESGEAKGPAALFDLAWALINSAEFLYRH
jgi:hypothetical protein